jgi:hypothetical protein
MIAFPTLAMVRPTPQAKLSKALSIAGKAISPLPTLR